MGLSSLLSHPRAGGLAAALLAGGVLFAQAAPAAAAPTPVSTPKAAAASSSSTGGSTVAGSTPASVAPSTPIRRPAATAPPAPTDFGPPCPGTAGAAKYPVICLPTGSGEEQTASLTPGDYVEFDAQVVNNGPAVKDATVVITLPTGLQLESDEDDPVYRIENWYEDDGDDGDYTDLTCTGGASTITCDIGALAVHANILIGVDLQVDQDAVPGTTQTFSVALQPVGTPTYPSTSVTAAILVLQPSHLVVSLTPATPRTVVGHRATVTGTVRNVGPGAAPGTIAVALTVDEKHPTSTHFTITNGVDPTTPDGSKIVITGVRTVSAVQARLQRQALSRSGSTVRRHALPAIRFWPLGTIAAGAVKQVPIKLKALSLGTDTLTFGALSTSGADDSVCDGGSSGGGSSSAPASASALLARAPQGASSTTAPADCSFVVQTHITAIRPPAATAPLADTGTNGLDAQLGVAVWAVVLGAGLVWAGRRRRLAAGRHRS